MISFPRIVFLLTVLLASAGAHAERIQLGLEFPVYDDQAIQILTIYKAKPRAAFIRTGAFGGTYRTSEKLSPQEFVANTRAQAVEVFTSAVDTNQQLLASALEHMTPDQLAAEDTGGRGEARPTVRALFKMLREARQRLSHVTDGAPIIYGLAMDVRPAAVDYTLHPLVRKAIKVGLFESHRERRRPNISLPRPKPVYSDPEADAMTVSELHQRATREVTQ